MTRGVYFLGNDRVVELAHAFLNSFRAHNPTLPLCYIPFDCDFSVIARLRERYRFSVYEGPDTLLACDQFSRRFHPRVQGHYRKLACWNGPFDEFIYIDLDTVVLSSLEPMFPMLEKASFIACDGGFEWVWRAGIRDVPALSQEQLSYAVSTGFIVSRRSALPFGELETRVRAAAELKEHMELSCIEQPLLNYLIVTSGCRYTTLDALIREGNALRRNVWSGWKGAEVSDGEVRIPGQGNALFMHWAGDWHLRPWQHRLYDILRSFGVRKPVMRPFVPYRKLWKYYRYLELPALPLAPAPSKEPRPVPMGAQGGV